MTFVSDKISEFKFISDKKSEFKVISDKTSEFKVSVLRIVDIGTARHIYHLLGKEKSKKKIKDNINYKTTVIQVSCLSVNLLT